MYQLTQINKVISLFIKEPCSIFFASDISERLDIPLSSVYRLHKIWLYVMRDLYIDNMQNLDTQTIREIKIIHEEIKTLSVIFFLKNDTKILNLLEEVEIGQRVNHYNMTKLEDKEVLKIAKTLGARFEDKLTEKRFIQIANGNPLTTKHLCKLAGTNLITLKSLMQIELKFINFLRREYRVSIRDIEQALKEEEKEASRGFVSEVLTGKTFRKLSTSNSREKERTSKSPHLHTTKHNQ